MKRITLLCGSRKPAPGDDSRSAAREMLREVERGVRVTGHESAWLDLRELTLPWWDGRTGREYGNADLNHVCERIAASSAVVISAPSYWDALSGVVKNVFDLTGPDPWRGRVVAGLVVGMNDSSAYHGEDQLRQVVSAVGAWWAPYAFTIGNPRSHADRAQLRKDLRRFGTYVGLMADPERRQAGDGTDEERGVADERAGQPDSPSRQAAGR
ncbi:NAD(P)H-dependent oxidoreductase [Haloechinothrix sp. LS1_15]|uniref:NADPH-dependent FMN reductase n=1 Tax=Haloechinothrix sp. LS1_15 TaxID=2652248 RepID=UPI00294673B5|nr:NAD(P)H-dependent oxidoreductase [Haloechinothrix sp. LS1_15]MDV6011963.1 NAD(P)H-dependent oxidoreductase [Haloechinothrix sp. LS1_15]